MLRRVAIIGAGAHGREVLEILRSRCEKGERIPIAGFVDDDSSLWGSTVDGLPVLGGWEWFQSVERYEVSVICGSGFSEIRKDIARRAEALGLSFANAISPHACVSANARIGTGVVIYQTAVVCRGAVVGDHVILNSGAIVSHDTMLGSYSTLNPGVNLAGDITIGEGCYLGIGCSVIQGLNVGAWTTVGAGAAVVSDLPAEVTAVGVPARVIKTKDRGLHEKLTSFAGR